MKVLDPANKALAIQKACVVGIGPSAPPSAPGGSGSPAAGTPPPTGRYGETLPGGPPAGTPPSSPQPPPARQSELEIKVTGPSAKLTVGEIASFVIEIKNSGTKTLTNLKVEALLDPAFERETGKTIASQGFWNDKGVLCYLQPNLPAGQKLVLEIQSKCLKPAPQAVAYVRVASAEGARRKAKRSARSLRRARLREPRPARRRNRNCS